MGGDAKKQRSVQENRITDKTNAVESDYNSYINDAIGESASNRNLYWGDNKYLRGEYDKWAQTGGMTPEMYARFGAGPGGAGGGGGGGSDGGAGGLESNVGKVQFGGPREAKLSDFTEERAGYRGFTGAGGGLDQGYLDKSGVTLDKLRNRGAPGGVLGNMINTGGFSQEDLGNINRESLKEFEKTGGWSEQDKSNVRARQASAAPSYYNAIGQNMSQMQNAAGVNLGSMGAMNKSLARQGAQQSARDRLDTEIGLGESIRSGRMGAANTLASNYLNMTGQRNANQLAGLGEERAGMTAAEQMALDQQKLISGNRLAGLGGLTETGKISGDQSLTQAGLSNQFTLGMGGLELQKAQGMDQFAMEQARASAAASNARAANDFAMNKYLTDTELGGRQYGLEGMKGLMNSEDARELYYDQNRLNAINSKADYTLGGLGAYSENQQVNKPTSAWDYVGQVASAAAGGLAGGLTMGMGPAIGGLAKKATQGAPTAPMGGGGYNPGTITPGNLRQGSRIFG